MRERSPKSRLRVLFLYHFLVVYTLYLLANRIGGNTENFLSLVTLIQFLLVYVLVWAVVVFMTRQKVTKINEKLRERKHSLDKGH
ncbi:DUF3021 family protein [Streptococcus oriscaviae]|uniref:DUF3021 family protein n=1 Tax=Streptococcus oriscaviae TaxID=2781599 RepID=A0ABX7YIY0_9STRE|nr:DUF3021 family protein [Streptococcus oriscaviae]QUE53773.1 DUF3021 family protein [Streptococcus oriscaviae]